MGKTHKIFVINVGSTSMKAALFEDERAVFEVRTTHDKDTLMSFRDVKEMIVHFKSALLSELTANNVSLRRLRAAPSRLPPSFRDASQAGLPRSR
jgi:butyrate kinase